MRGEGEKRERGVLFWGGVEEVVEGVFFLDEEVVKVKGRALLPFGC